MTAVAVGSGAVTAVSPLHAASAVTANKRLRQRARHCNGWRLASGASAGFMNVLGHLPQRPHQQHRRGWPHVGVADAQFQQLLWIERDSRVVHGKGQLGFAYLLYLIGQLPDPVASTWGHWDRGCPCIRRSPSALWQPGRRRPTRLSSQCRQCPWRPRSLPKAAPLRWTGGCAPAKAQNRNRAALLPPAAPRWPKGA